MHHKALFYIRELLDNKCTDIFCSLKTLSKMYLFKSWTIYSVVWPLSMHYDYVLFHFDDQNDFIQFRWKPNKNSNKILKDTNNVSINAQRPAYELSKKIFIVNLYPEAFTIFICISTHLAKQVDTQMPNEHRSSHCFLAFTRCPLKLVSIFFLFLEKLNVFDK